jgi:hypothetical protein
LSSAAHTILVADLEDVLAQTASAAPILRRRLAQAQVQPLDPSTHLSRLMTGQPHPLAPLTYLADFGHPPQGYCLRADPVRLVPDLAAVWMHSGHLPIESTLAQTLTTALTEFGLQFQLASPERGYVLCQRPPQCQFTTPWAARGESLDAIMPAGPDAAFWRRVLNDTQVLAHQHQTEGQVVGGLWVHSGGDAVANPAAPLIASVRALHADTALVARALGVEQVVGDDQVQFLEWAPTEPDPQAAIAELERVLKPLWSRLRWGRLAHLTLASPKRAWHWRPRDLWRLSRPGAPS